MTTVIDALQLATKYHQFNRLDRAEQIYRQILEAQPDHLEALYRLGLLSQQTNKFEEAEKFLSAALQVQPELVNAWFSLGNLRQTQGKLKTAEAAYRQALDLQPNLVAIHNNLGYTLEKQGFFEEAISSYQKALELQPDCTEADVNWGNALHTQGKLSPEKQAHYAKLNYKLGLVREQARDLNNAIAYYRQAIALQQNFWEAHYHLGIVLQLQGKLEEAITSCHRALALNSHNWEIYACLGQIYQAQKNFTEAVAIYRQGLSILNPHYAEAVKAGQNSTIQITPSIPQSEVTVGAYQFPAIQPVADPDSRRPFWTVVIPIYNRTDYLLECLASVLVQWPGETEMEILVVDNASTSPLYELVTALACGIVHYYRNSENIGHTRNMNVGISLSRGEWIHVLHDDDSVFPSFYSSLQQSLKACSDKIGAACTGFEYINEKGMATSLGEINSVYGQNRGTLQDWLSRIGVCGLVMTPALVVRRATHERLGGYSPEIPNINDWELHKRIAAFYEWWYEPEILVRSRVHSDSGTSNSWKSGDMSVQVYQTIQMSESYLPVDCRTEITKQARMQNFNYCLAHALVPLKNGNLQGTLGIVQYALKIDSSPQSVARLFAWLTQDEAAPVRDEIVSTVLLSTVGLKKSQLKNNNNNYENTKNNK